MRKNKIEIQNKLINHITLNGKKKTSEKTLLKSLKALQKNSIKQSNHTIKLAIINSTPIFKTHNISNKKQKKRNKKTREIPSFIKTQNSRTSLSLKLILKGLKNKKPKYFYLKLKEEIVLAAELKSNSMLFKNELQQKSLLNKRFFRYYRW